MDWWWCCRPRAPTSPASEGWNGSVAAAAATAADEADEVGMGGGTEVGIEDIIDDMEAV